MLCGQTLQNKDITVYGTGDQTRSFQYVSDLVDGLILLMESDYNKPVSVDRAPTTTRFWHHGLAVSPWRPRPLPPPAPVWAGESGQPGRVHDE